MMPSTGILMAGRVVVEEAPDVLHPEALRQRLNTNDCGAVVSFVGLTRETEGTADVLRLEFDAWQDRLTPVLERLAHEAINDLESSPSPWHIGQVPSDRRSPSSPSMSAARIEKRPFRRANGSLTN